MGLSSGEAACKLHIGHCRGEGPLEFLAQGCEPIRLRDLRSHVRVQAGIRDLDELLDCWHDFEA